MPKKSLHSSCQLQRHLKRHHGWKLRCDAIAARTRRLCRRNGAQTQINSLKPRKARVLATAVSGCRIQSLAWALSAAVRYSAMTSSLSKNSLTAERSTFIRMNTATGHRPISYRRNRSHRDDTTRELDEYHRDHPDPAGEPRLAQAAASRTAAETVLAHD